MNGDSQAPVIYLRLDALSDDKHLFDSSEHGNEGIAAGSVEIIADDMFGTSAHFNGVDATISVPYSDTFALRQYTSELWFLLETGGSKAQPAAKKSKVPPAVPAQPVKLQPNVVMQALVGMFGANFQVWLNVNNASIEYRYRLSGRPETLTLNTPPNSVVADQWQHIAVTDDGTKVTIYINGVKSAEAAVSGDNPGEKYPLVIGSDPKGGNAGSFTGRLANVRLYNRALSEQEIGLDMDADTTAFSAFSLTYPIDFQLIDDDDQSVIYIEDNPAGDNLRFEVINTSRQAITFSAPSSNVATEDNHHLELRFRPGTLSQATLQGITLSATDWVMSQSVTPSTGAVSLFFLRTALLTLNPTNSAALILQHISADGAGGARGSRAELHYKQLQYVGQTEELIGNRLRHFNIVNRVGRRTIPLHVGFTGTNVILNDSATVNTLNLRISNVLREGNITFNRADLDAPSRLVIMFDAAETIAQEWALGTLSQVQAISVQDTTHTWQSSENTEAQNPEWILTTATDFRLGAQEFIEIQIGNIISSLPSGQTNLYLHYENVPGYQDGTFVAVIEKSPLLFWNSNVGIGVAQPAAKLHIVNANQDANGNSLIIGPTNQSHLRLGYHQNYSWIQSHGNKPLVLNSVGNNVGVGVTDPGAKLHIVNTNQDANGNSLIIGPTTQSNLRLGYNQNYSWIQSHGSKPLAINSIGNNVGIGTTDPGAYKLNVQGDTLVSGAAHSGALEINSHYRFSHVQAGHLQAGSNGSNGVKEVRINFPEPFARKPQAVITPRNEGFYSDTYAATIKYIDGNYMLINIIRLDSLGHSWGQNLRIEWIAWETPAAYE